MGYIPTQKEVERCFSEKGCKLLDVYKHSKIKLRFICLCGQERFIRYDGFKKGSRCRQCGNKKAAKTRTGLITKKTRLDKKEAKAEKDFSRISYYYLTECKKNKNNIRQLDIDRLGYSGIELFYRLTSHPNWVKCRFKNQKWHIDHIFPIIAFYNAGITDLKIINSLDNLQPLSHEDNTSKARKFDSDGFNKYLKSKGIYL